MKSFKALFAWTAMLAITSVVAIGAAAALDDDEVPVRPATPSPAEEHGREHSDVNSGHDSAPHHDEADHDHDVDSEDPRLPPSLEELVTVSNDDGDEVELEFGELLDLVNELDETNGLPENQHYGYGVMDNGEFGPTELCTVTEDVPDVTATVSVCEPLR